MINEKFTKFLAALHAQNPSLLESVYEGYTTLFEDDESVPVDFASNVSSVEADFDDKGRTSGTMHINMNVVPEVKQLIASVMHTGDADDIEKLRNANSIVFNIPFSFSGGTYVDSYYSGGKKYANDPGDSEADLEDVELLIDNDGENDVTDENGNYICSIDIEKNSDLLSSVMEICTDNYEESAIEHLLEIMEESHEDDRDASDYDSYDDSYPF